MLTIFGACAVTFMMLMYAFERRDRRFILAFACGCALSSVYGFLAGTWPFGVVEAIWAAIALRRYVQSGHQARPSSAQSPDRPRGSPERDRERSLLR
jgi:predicted membrane-bound mannosyltransferase